jgi:hypothetical protein
VDAGAGRADLPGGGEAGVSAHGAATVRLLQVHQKENQGGHLFKKYIVHKKKCRVELKGNLSLKNYLAYLCCENIFGQWLFVFKSVFLAFNAL